MSEAAEWIRQAADEIDAARSAIGFGDLDVPDDESADILAAMDDDILAPAASTLRELAINVEVRDDDDGE